MDRRHLVEAVHAAPDLAVLVVTGGGAGLLRDLLVVPGASRTVLEAVVPYSEAALASWLGGPVAGAASADTAARMAEAALRRAADLVAAAPAADGPPPPLVGLAITAALASDRPKRGDHRAHLATRRQARPGGPVLAQDWAVTLDKGRRPRAEEDDVVAGLGLVVLARACGLDAPLDPLGATDDGVGLGPGDRLTC